MSRLPEVARSETGRVREDQRLLALEVLEASSASISQVEHEHGLLRVLHNVGQLADRE